jgi:hypothetical protein
MQNKKLPKDPHRWVMLPGNVFVWAEFGPPVPVSLPRHFEKVRGCGIKMVKKSDRIVLCVAWLGLLVTVLSSKKQKSKEDCTTPY